MPDEVDVDALVECADEIARRLCVAPAATDLVRSVIQDVLFARGSLDAAAAGIISETELVNLVLAHLSDLVCEGDHLPEDWMTDDLVDCVRTAIRG